MNIHLIYHILIHMLIHISYISFTHAYTYLILTNNILFHFLSTFIYILCHFTLCFLFLSSHNSAMFLISFHIMSFIIFKSFSYSCHLFLYFMPAYTLEVDMRNYKDLKVLLSLYDIMNYKGSKALLSLYETMTSIRTRR